MKISIALATYNGERFLREQLESLAAQTLRPCELVVGDDGSRDRTPEILERFAAGAPFPVRVQRNERRYDSGDNFLHTAHRCGGDWIAFCDQDDVWEPGKLGRMAEILQGDARIVFGAHRATIIDEQGIPRGEHNEPLEERLSIARPLGRRPWRTPFGFTQVFRRFLIQDLPFERRPKSEHDVWIFWLANALGRTAFVPDRLARYRRHDANKSRFTDNPTVANQLASSAWGETYASAAGRTEEFSAFLRAQAGGLPKELRSQAAESARVYARMTAHLRRRAAIWGAGRARSARLGLWGRLMAGGGYGPAHIGGAGWKAGAKDLVRAAGLRESA